MYDFSFSETMMPVRVNGRFQHKGQTKCDRSIWLQDLQIANFSSFVCRSIYERDAAKKNTFLKKNEML